MAVESNMHFKSYFLLLYLAVDATSNCICEIHCLALDGYNLNTVHKLSSKEKKFLAEPGFDIGAAGLEARMLPLCYAAHKA